MASKNTEKYAGLKIEDIINEIAEYENLAKTMMEEGKAEAEKTIANAEKKGKELFELKEKEAHAEAERILKDAETTAGKMHKEIVIAASRQIEEMNSVYSEIKEEIVTELAKTIIT
ncbi:MAG: hypothetical protein DRP57_07740 [Spirochaetes bacterium]|nr:MAG: hypothetical protein DRP57_07740 [Spirochaetota bacterium]